MKTVVSLDDRCLPPSAPKSMAGWFITNNSQRNLSGFGGALLVCAAIVLSPSTAQAALVDQWRAETLATLNDGDAVGSWTSANSRTAGASVGLQPVLKRNVTPAGGPVVRFNRHFMTVPVGNSPIGGTTAFSIAIVFKADAAGTNGANNNWYGMSGLVDAEQGGIVADWGLVLENNGRIAGGTGSPDITTIATAPSLVDSNFHVAVFTWGSGSQSLYVDNRAPATQAGTSTAARNNAGLAFGGILTTEGGASRRFIGDIAEIGFYNSKLSATEVSNLVAQLTDTHIIGGRPVIRFFAATTNLILLSNSVTLSWNVTNAANISIDPGMGSVSNPSGAVQVFPTTTTTYTLTATNELGSRSAQVTVVVDPGIPIAYSQSVTTLQNTARSITLSGADPNGGTLTYAIVGQPQHGALTGTPPNVTFTPTPGFFGNDAFTFNVNDGSYDSLAATISLRVNAPPAPPTAVTLSTTNISENAAPGSFLAGLASIDINTEETHTYTLVPGFGDNALFTISGNQLRAGPAYAGGAGATFTLRVRDTDSSALFVEQTFTLRVIEILQGIVINEIHYNGPVNQIREEFIELCNATAIEADLSFWQLRGGVDYTLPQGTILPAGGFLVIAQNPATILSRYGVAALGPWDGALNNEGEALTFRNADGDTLDKVEFRSEFPWPIRANGDGPSMELVNPALDNDLGSSWRSSTPPTPGAINTSFLANAAPNLRQVNHSPDQPGSTNSVAITCKVTDPEGVASVQLSYQVVAPGNYLPATLPLTRTQLDSLTTNPALTNALNPAFEAAANWTTVAMTDDGLNGDEIAGDRLFTVVLPQQAHRTLVRYRITTTDTLGASRRAPFEDDPSLNFAYFVYDGVPAYQGFSSAVLQTLPVYSLVTRSADMDQCTAWNNSADQLPGFIGPPNEGRFHFNWEGAMVYDGVVYDHIRYRLRGANGRYHPGKRSFRFKFNDGSYLAAKDQTGQNFPTKWRELTTGKGQANQGMETFALNEVVNYFLWNKVGVPTPFTFHFHFRVIKGAAEAPGPYTGDFWGLNWAQEKYDVRFLDSHKLPKGNLYKLNDYKVDFSSEERYLAANAVTNGGDFNNIQANLKGTQSTDWLLAHVNYTNWYRYNAVCEAIRHYDFWPSANKNGTWYFEPVYGASNSFYGRMLTLPYDTTDTWGPTWNSGFDIAYNGIFNVFSPPVPPGAPINTTGGDTGDNPELQKEYRNTVREVRDLLFQPDQIIPLIDAFAAPIKNFVPADLVRWSNAPSPSGYIFIQNGFSGGPGVAGGLNGYAQDMKDFMFLGGTRGWWRDRTSVTTAGGWISRLDAVAADPNIPVRPTITYAGPPGFPSDGLLFQSSAFSDPQGSGTFASMQWRIAEITPANTAVSGPQSLKLEWDAAWDSGELPVFNNQITFPTAYVEAGKFYRARVRHKDTSGRWSRWSDYLEFVPSPPNTVVELRGSLVFSEIMYNPIVQGTTDSDEFEFLELKNIGTATLTLSGLFFSAGINFTFTNGTTLAPNATFLLSRNPSALQSKYPGLIVNGVYSGRLDNAGETLTIRHPQGFDVLSVTYVDDSPAGLAADGLGFSLVLTDEASATYRASTEAGGSPGAENPSPTIPVILINEAFTSSTFPDVDAIELHNPSAVLDVDLSHWYLTDDPHYPWKYRFPDGTLLRAGNYLVVDESQFNFTPGIGASFALSSLGDEVYLFSGNANFEITGYSHGFQFSGAQTGVSFGRYVNSAGQEHFPAQITRTLETNNAGPRVGPVVINEIHYNPAAGGDEFVELLNASPGTVQLFDPANPTNTWRLDGIGHTFPSGATLAPNQLLLIVAGDPVAFRSKYNIPAQVAVFGAVSGNLQDSGERLQLLAPDAPTTNGTPYFAIEDIRYNDRLPWPPAADGAGASLQRRQPSAYGNEPANWSAAIPTPGLLLPQGNSPVITSQPSPQERTAVAGQPAIFSVIATGPGPLFYQWRFNNDKISGGTNSTLILPNVATSQAGNYTVDVFNRFGSATSWNVNLTVLTPAFITQHPQSLTVRPGSNIVFTVAATSRTPFNYQWRFNGGAIPGATGPIYPLNNVQLANDGLYDVVITDGVGPAVSQPAILTVLVNPAIVQPPLSQTVVAGDNVTVSVGITGNPPPFGYQWRRGSLLYPLIILNEKTSLFTFTNVQPGITWRVIVTNAASTGITVNASFNLTVLADSDTDGLPDDWELAHGLLPDVPDALLDSDLDGVSNRSEYLAGTNPTNGLSYLKVDHISANGPTALEFIAVSNRTYTVQYKQSLDDPLWQKLVNVVAHTTNGTRRIVDPNPGTGRFYRLVTPGQP
jgi:hypothetical protein